MKKLSIFLTMALVALGLASCDEDRDPVYHAPTQFVLNQPAMEDQYIDLTAGNTLELVASQPDYGYSAVANYSAEMSLTEDFATFEALEATDAHQARMTFKQEDIALALCKLLKIEGEDDYNSRYPNGMPYTKIYFRAVCQLTGVGDSMITSNVVAYNNIKGYLAIPTPGYIYLVGNPEGWAGPTEANAEHYAPWRLFEPSDAIGSKVYVGTFDLPAAPMFRFYTQLTGWDADSYGYIVDDNATDFEIVGNSFTETIIKGKGAFNFPNFAGGKVTLVVDMSDANNMTFTMTLGDVKPTVTKYVYMVGNNGGWAEPAAGTTAYDDWKLADSDGSGIYTGTFDFTDFTADEGFLYCRFYQELAGWGPAQWSSDAAGGNVEVASGVPAPTFAGEGCFMMPVTGHKVQISLDTNNDQVTFTYAD